MAPINGLQFCDLDVSENEESVLILIQTLIAMVFNKSLIVVNGVQNICASGNTLVT